MCALTLELEHHLGETRWADVDAMSKLAQPEVLTVHAACLAATEKDCTGATRAGDRRLLAPVQVPRADDDIAARATGSCLAREAIHWTVLRADRAAAQQLPG